MRGRQRRGERHQRDQAELAEAVAERAVDQLAEPVGEREGGGDQRGLAGADLELARELRQQRIGDPHRRDRDEGRGAEQRDRAPGRGRARCGPGRPRPCAQAQGSGRRDPELLGPARERVHDAGMEADALGQGLALPRQRALARQAHRVDPRRRRVAPAGRSQPAGLPEESGGAAERRRVHHLQPDRGAPVGQRVGAAMAGQPLAQRLDRERQVVALVAVILAAGRQQRAGRLGEDHVRIVRGRAARGHRPLAGKTPAGGAQPRGHAVGGDRGAHVDQDRLAPRSGCRPRSGPA